MFTRFFRDGQCDNARGKKSAAGRFVTYAALHSNADAVLQDQDADNE